MTIATRTIAESRLFDQLSPWLDQWGDSVRAFQVVRTEARAYSEIRVVVVESAGRREKLVCKRSIHRTCNTIYRARGSAAKVEFDALSRVHARMSAELDCCVPKPSFVRPELGLLVMDFVTGRSLERSLSAARVTSSSSAQRQAENHFRRVGRWLRCFQSNMKVEWAQPGVLDQTLTLCDDRLKMIQEHGHALIPSSFRLTTMQYLVQLRDSLRGSIPISDCHGDFGPWNVLVDEQHVAVIDFFSHRRDCLLTDPLEMLVYLESQQYSPSLSRKRIQCLQNAFLDGFDCQREWAPELVSLCEAHHRIRRIHDCLLHERSHWRGQYRLARVLRDNLQWFLQRQPARFHDQFIRSKAG